MTPPRRPRFPFPLLFFWLKRTLPLWGAIALMIFVIQISFCGILHDNESVKTFLDFIHLLPAFVKILLGGEALREGNVSALIAIGYHHPLVLILYMLFAVGTPTGFLAGEVQKGTMELILSRSTTRTQVYLCAGVITIVGMFALALVMFFGTVVAVNLYDFDETVALSPFFKTAVNGGLLASAVGAIALLSAALFQNRGRAIGLTVAYLVVNYFVSFVAEWWPWMNFLAPTTLFYYASGPAAFSSGVAWPVGDMCVLTTVLFAAAVGGGVIWQRRDLPL